MHATEMTDIKKLSWMLNFSNLVHLMLQELINEPMVEENLIKPLFYGSKHANFMCN